jgi:CheY-like chemotaxis protein
VRLRILRAPQGHADGFDLRRFQIGQIYDVGTALANLLLAEGWGVPVDVQEPALVVPLSTMSQKTVLVVDDDRDVRAMLTTLLGVAGFDVIEASNGGDALAALVKHRPSLIILDLMMPGMDGAQFRQAQRRLQDHELADVPVLVVSGADNLKHLARNLGAAGMFEKPLNPERILAAVQARISKMAS